MALAPSTPVNPVLGALATVILVGLFLLLGKYHVVSGAPGVLVQREHFGFSDTFASVDECTNAPKFIVMALHPSLCGALWRDGIVVNAN